MKAHEALIAWTPTFRDSPTAGQVAVGTLRGGHEWTKPYTTSGGAAYTATRQLRGEASALMLFIEFHTIVVRDGLDPQKVHQAFLKIDEYAERISPDISGATQD
jgi:hypothetical protein